ncbi:MAG: hypothetical protein ACMXYD_03255 [Candidatus Woesearchaeota archaeon]
MKLYQLTLLLILVAGITVLLVTAVNQRVESSSAQIPYHFVVDETIGFDVATDALRFGALASGSIGTRDVHIEQPGVYAIRIRGEGAEYMSTPTPRTSKNQTTITFTVRIPEGAAKQEYTGTIHFVAQ